MAQFALLLCIWTCNDLGLFVSTLLADILYVTVPNVKTSAPLFNSVLCRAANGSCRRGAFRPLAVLAPKLRIIVHWFKRNG